MVVIIIIPISSMKETSINICTQKSWMMYLVQQLSQASLNSNRGYVLVYCLYCIKTAIICRIINIVIMTDDPNKISLKTRKVLCKERIVIQQNKKCNDTKRSNHIHLLFSFCIRFM